MHQKAAGAAADFEHFRTAFQALRHVFEIWQDLARGGGMQSADCITNGVGKGVAAALERDRLTTMKRLAAQFEILGQEGGTESHIAGQVARMPRRSQDLVYVWREAVAALLIGIQQAESERSRVWRR